MAILRVGGKSISALTENSREAEICNVFYEGCRDQLLCMHPWNFARKTVDLALIAGDSPDNWGFVYALPTDCLKILSILVPGARVLRAKERVPFVMGVWGGAKAVFTDMQDAVLEYTCLPDESFSPAAFESALAWLLASELAGPLFGKPDLASASKTAYWKELSVAQAQDLNEQSDQEPESEFISVRGLSNVFLADGRIDR